MASPKLETAIFGGGCFWCTEAIFGQLRGVAAVSPGYSGGIKPNPTYDEVCGGATGHAEVIKIEYDPATISYEDLLEVFWATHDPTTPNRQGADTGPQYRSLMLYTNQAQRKTATQSLKKAQLNFSAPIVTKIAPLTTFWPAENYHRQYFQKHQSAPYCQLIISPKLKHLREKFADKLKHSLTYNFSSS